MNSKKRAKIKSYAQTKKAKIQIGAAELHDNIYQTINNSFNNEEVIKIKVNRSDKSDKQVVRDMSKTIVENVECEFVDIIGTTIILYKESKDESKRQDFE